MSAQPARLQEPVKSSDGVKRLNLNLSEEVFNELSRLAKERRSSMTEIIRLALSLVKVALYEAKQGNKLVVTTADGTAVKELVVAL
jgi:Ribbon-helix-helix protein, copG family